MTAARTLSFSFSRGEGEGLVVIGKKKMELEEASSYFAIPLALTRGKIRYAAALMLVCALAFLGITLVLLASGRSLVWNTDGRLLYYPFMVAEGEWLRSIVLSAMNGVPEIPVYSFNLGFGADWLVTASGNSNEPINVLSVFCPPQYAEYFYGALTFLRFYLAALAFSLYCFSRGKGKREALCGSLCYVVCGFVLFWGVLRHPNFIDFAALLPLVFMGTDKVFAGKNPLLLIVSMAAVFVYSIYFAYMACIFLLFYCLLGYCFYPRQRSLPDFLLLAAKIIGCLIASFLLVGFSSVPMLLTLSSMGRVGVERELAFFRPIDFYASFGSVVLGNHTAQNAAVVGAVPVIALMILCVCGHLMPKADRRAWGCGAMLCVAGLSVSLAGSVMNGFGYSTDRWAVIFGFCAAYCVVLAIPVIPRLNKKQWIRLGILALVIGMWSLAYALTSKTLLAIAVAVMFLVIFLAILAWACLRRRAIKRMRDCDTVYALPTILRRDALPVLLCVAVIMNATVHVGLFLSPYGSSYYKEFIRTGHVASTREQLDLSGALDTIAQDYRVDRPDTTYGRNGSFVHGYKGMDFYSSFYNQAVDDFRQSLGLADDVKSTMFDGVQQRLALEALLGARYYIASSEAEQLVPEGYRRILELGEAHNGSTYSLFETNAVLPIAFTYTTTISQRDYEALSPVERQEAMTKALVLAAEDVDSDAIALSTESMQIDVEDENGAVVQDGRVVVTERNGTVTLHVKGEPDVENYLCFEGLTYAPTSRGTAVCLAKSPECSLVDCGSGQKESGPPSTWITMSSRLGDYSFEVATNASAKYSGKNDWAVNLGMADEPLESVSISFGAVGVYSFDELYACAQPQQAIRDNIERLRADNDASIQFGTNAFYVHVDAEELSGKSENQGDSRYVFVSIPYSAGWSATIDGAPIEIEKANVGFMAVEIDGEEHEIHFSYVMPGFRVGAACSGVAFFVIVVIEVLWFRRTRHKQKCDQ